MTSGVEACTVRHEQGIRNTRTSATGASARAVKARKERVGRRTIRPIQDQRDRDEERRQHRGQEVLPVGLELAKEARGERGAEERGVEVQVVAYCRWK